METDGQISQYQNCVPYPYDSKLEATSCFDFYCMNENSASDDEINLKCTYGECKDFQVKSKSLWSELRFAYIEYLDHVHQHILSEIKALNPALPFDAAEKLTFYEIRKTSEWNALVELAGEIYIPVECSWRTPDMDGYCYYEYKNLEDFMVHNYYHAHMTRLFALSQNVCFRYNLMTCNNIWQATGQIFSCDYKKEVRCRWNKIEDNKCEYMCLVPEFLEQHVLDEIENYWRPNLWKKDQKLSCFWDECEFVVETHLKGARPLTRLKNHIKMHLGIKHFVCSMCNQRFTNITRFQDHYGRQVESRTWECGTCKKTFPTERYLIIHQRTHVHLYRCPVKTCLQSSATFSSLCSHIKYCHSDKRNFGPCPFCAKMFKSRCDYKKHVQTHNKSREDVECELCHFTARTKNQVDYHKRIKHAANNTAEASGYKCHLCFKVYTRAFKLSAHFRLKHADANELFRSVKGRKNNRLRYIMGDDGYYILNECEYKLTNPKNIDLDRKVIKIQKEETETIEEYTGVDISNEVNEIEKKIYECKHCGRMYQLQNRVITHEAECDLRPDSEFKRIVSQHRVADNDDSNEAIHREDESGASNTDELERSFDDSVDTLTYNNQPDLMLKNDPATFEELHIKTDSSLLPDESSNDESLVVLMEDVPTSESPAFSADVPSQPIENESSSNMEIIKDDNKVYVKMTDPSGSSRIFLLQDPP